MRTYGSDQIKINNLYLNTRSKELRYVLFVTDKASSTGQAGYMRLNGQFGYVYKNAPIKTAAHELGHGIFKLEHPTASNTKLLMDYSESEILSHKDWQQIGDPAFKFYGFQDQSEGELAGGYAISPDYKVFSAGTTRTTYSSNKYIAPEGTLSGFVYAVDGKNYLWNTDAKQYLVNGTGEEFKDFVDVTNTYDISKTIYLFYENNLDCNERKYISVTNGKRVSPKELINLGQSKKVDWKILECSSSESSGNGGENWKDGSNGSGNGTNEELLQKANKIIEDKIKAQFPEKNITYTLLDKNDPDYEQKLAEALKKSNHVIATLEANGELKIDFSFETPDWLLKIIPDAGKSNDTCGKEYINEALKSLKRTDAYKSAPRADQIAMEVGVATYSGFFGILYCSTNEESCKNSSVPGKFLAGAINEGITNFDVVMMVEGIVTMVTKGGEAIVNSPVVYYNNLKTIAIKGDASPKEVLGVLLLPPTNTHITFIEKGIEIGEGFIKNYFTECDQYKLKDGSVANMCPYRNGQIAMMVAPLVITGGTLAVTKLKDIGKFAKLIGKTESLAKNILSLESKLTKKAVILEEKAGKTLIKNTEGKVLKEVDSTNATDIEKALDEIDDIVKGAGKVLDINELKALKEVMPTGKKLTNLKFINFTKGFDADFIASLGSKYADDLTKIKAGLDKGGDLTESIVSEALKKQGYTVTKDLGKYGPNNGFDVVAYKGTLDNPTEIMIIEGKQFKQNKILDEFDDVKSAQGYDEPSGLTINPANPQTGLPTQMSKKWTFEHVADKLNKKGGEHKKLAIALENENIVERFVFAIDKSTGAGYFTKLSDRF